jgi:hypothetical protein
MPKVFGVGLSKTGTKTLASCLRELGYRHSSWDPDLANRVLVDGDVSALDRTSQRYDSFDDLPWPMFYRRLDRMYPDSKFILTVRRSSDAWFESIRRHGEYKGPTAVREKVYGFAMPHAHRAAHVDVYERHTRQVQEYFAGHPEKLLVVCWEEERSWDRLCDFLGVPVPTVPLPHENRRRSARVGQYLRRVRYTLSGYAERLFQPGLG